MICIFLLIIVAIVESEICMRSRIDDGTDWVQLGTKLQRLDRGFSKEIIGIIQRCNDAKIIVNRKTYVKKTGEIDDICPLTRSPQNQKEIIIINRLRFRHIFNCVLYIFNMISNNEIEGVVWFPDGTCGHFNSGGSTNISGNATVCLPKFPFIRPVRAVASSYESFITQNVRECLLRVYKMPQYNFASFIYPKCYASKLNSRATNLLDDSGFNALTYYFVIRHPFINYCEGVSCFPGDCVLNDNACECPTGYRLNFHRGRCENINECHQEPAVCDHICSDTEGSFTCSCRDGFFLSDDARSCTDKQECGENPCSQRCSIKNGVFVCSCEVGYILKSDGKNCQRIDWRTNTLVYSATLSGASIVGLTVIGGIINLALKKKKEKEFKPRQEFPD